MKLSDLGTTTVVVNTKPVKSEPQKIDPVLAAALTTARDKTNRILKRHQLMPFSAWAQIEKDYSVQVPIEYKSKEVTYANIAGFCHWYVGATPQRIAFTKAHVVNQPIAVPVWKTGDLLPFNLNPPYRDIPRQRKAVTQIVSELWQSKRTNAALAPMPMGSGKTLVAASVIIWLQQNHYMGAKAFGLFNVIYLVPKPVKLDIIAAFTKAGVKGLGTEVHVISYSQLRSKKFMSWFTKTSEDRFGTPTEVFKWRLPPPAFIIADEYQFLKKQSAKCSKVAQAWLSDPTTKWLCMSGTPGATINDLQFFALASRMRFGDGHIDRNNWREFARIVGQTDPALPNAAAMERFKKFFGTAIINPPADPKKVKAYNKVLTIPFASKEDEQSYRNAENVWLETCERLGKIVSERGQVMAATTIFRAAEERLKAVPFAKLAIDAVNNGFAAVIAVSFIDTVKRTVAELARQGVSRDQISIIWGGQKEIKESDCYTPMQWYSLQTKIELLPNGIDDLDKKTAAKFRRTSLYMQDRWRAKETEEEQRERNEWLKEMRLHKQSDAERQVEKENFLSGRTQYCIFTLGSGATGISLDHQRIEARPRKVFSTICYYMEQFCQAFGRCYREVTLSDVEQNAVFFANTIVANHVAPILAKKLASVNKLAGTGINIEDQLISAASSGKLRTEVKVDLTKLETVVTDEVIDDTEVDPDDEEDDVEDEE